MTSLNLEIIEAKPHSNGDDFEVTLRTRLNKHDMGELVKMSKGGYVELEFSL